MSAPLRHVGLWGPGTGLGPRPPGARTPHPVQCPGDTHSWAREERLMGHQKGVLTRGREAILQWHLLLEGHVTRGCRQAWLRGTLSCLL